MTGLKCHGLHCSRMQLRCSRQCHLADCSIDKPDDNNNKEDDKDEGSN